MEVLVQMIFSCEWVIFYLPCERKGAMCERKGAMNRAIGESLQKTGSDVDPPLGFDPQICVFTPFEWNH